MSLGAKLLVGALVLGAAGTAGTYVVTNGSFGIGGNGEGSSENTQIASNQNAPAPQAGASPSSDEAGRAASKTSLDSQQSSNPTQKEDIQGVSASSGDVPQEKVQNTGSLDTRDKNQQQGLNGIVSGENRSQLQSEPSVTPLVTDQSGTKVQPAPAGEDNPQEEGGGNIDPGKSKGETDSASLPVLGGAEDPKSSLQSNPTGGAQDQEATTLQVTESNA